MTRTHANVENLPDAAVEENRIGTDRDGAEHFHCAVRSHVYVVLDGELVHTQTVDSLALWIEHIDHRVGWESSRVSNRPLEDWLSEGLVA